MSFHKQGDLVRARTAYQEVLHIQPLHFDSLHSLGVLARQTGDLALAKQYISQAINLQPNNATYHSNLGSILQELGEVEDSILSFDLAITLRPDFEQAYYNRGNALRSLGRFDEAIASYDKAIAYAPHFTLAFYNRGRAQMALQRLDAALISFEQVLALDKNHLDAHFQRGNVLKLLGRNADAIASYEMVISLQPNHAEAFLNRGIALHELKELALAVESYDAAIAIRPEDAKANWNKSLALLAMGDYANGWVLYDWRWKVPDFITKPLRTSRPLWNGAQGRRVLAWAEQGIGEELMFSSFIREMSQLCTRLIVKVDPRLVPLLARSFGSAVATFVASNYTIGEEGYDEHIPLGDLCRYLRPHRESFQRSQLGYLIADAGRTQEIRDNLLTGEPKRLCGLSWYCKNSDTGAARSIELESLIASLASTGYHFVNLQYGDTAEEVRDVFLKTGVSILNCSDVDNFNDLDGLASLIASCDVIVSVDNSTAHLAGALGKDVRVLLPFMPDWRWQLEGDRTPWYPSMKLYRQAQQGDWGDVLGGIVSDLRVS